jgi:hypothetical protein
MNVQLVILIVLLFLNIPLYKALFRLFFVDDNDYNQSIKHVFTPNIISLFRGEYWQDRLNTLRLQFFVLLCIGIVFLEFFLIRYAISLF